MKLSTNHPAVIRYIDEMIPLYGKLSDLHKALKIETSFSARLVTKFRDPEKFDAYPVYYFKFRTNEDYVAFMLRWSDECT